jgi:hypothetical protein
MRNTDKIVYSVLIPHDTLESYFILNHREEFIDFFVPLLLALKPIQETQRGTRQRNRSTRFHRLSSEHRSQSSVLHLRTLPLNTSSMMINDLSSKSLENNTKILFGSIRIVRLSTGRTCQSVRTATVRQLSL